MSTTSLTQWTASRQRAIGPLGSGARICVGVVLVGSVLAGHVTGGFRPWSWVLGLAGFPAAVVAWQRWRARRDPSRLHAIGSLAHALNMAVFLILYLVEPTSDAALLFYGASMLLAAARGYAGCEVLTVSNWILHRDDQIGCAVFGPVDSIERRRDRSDQV